MSENVLLVDEKVSEYWHCPLYANSVMKSTSQCINYKRGNF